MTKQLAVRNVGQSEEDFWGFDRKSDFLTTSHVIRLFGAGTQVRRVSSFSTDIDSLPNQTHVLCMLLVPSICSMLDMLLFLRKLERTICFSPFLDVL